ncbi:MAG: SufD family Fe-S cluster assembly protein [Ruminococcaceae bacterium]|nr:SufD family Fe-S cluster assembly protein [Oscillospiraceae bacterium]
MDKIERNLLEQIAGLHEIPSGAYNIRSNSQSFARNVTANINIVTKEDKPGIDVYIKAGTKRESVHIPVIISQSGLEEIVYNDFYIGEDADVLIVAGCGIHNGGDARSSHDGIHAFHLAKGAKVKYVEKHYGSGDGKGERVMNPTTEVYIDKDGYMEMETVQIKGVDSTKRVTKAVLGDNATLVVSEKLMTHGTQYAETEFDVALNGENSSTHVVSRSVAKEKSHQLFLSKVSGNNKCSGHTECDAIIMDEASVQAIPEITANSIDASLIHEAAIGKIAGEQIIKLMTLGLTEKEAEEQIINGFLK